MVMAPCTGHGQAHEPARHHINTIINDVMSVVDKVAADGDETQRCHVGWRFQIVQLIRRQLFHDKPVIGSILIECSDDIITISKCPWKLRLFKENITLVVSIPGHVHPVPSPVFSVARRGHEAIHQPRNGVGR